MSQDFDETSFSTHNDHDLHYISTPRENIYETSAVVIEGGFKSYGTCTVFQDFQMTVPKGVIYGLLGASGCGKTTVLECTIGSKRLDKGHVYVLGQRLSSANNRKRIGYMPQKIGLYGDLTVQEIMLFFGCITEMGKDKVRQRAKYLIDLLDLPHNNLQLKKLSGGQQRRVSLALAFLNEPELLILDEPTVGVDAVLRQLIWDHFVSLVKNGGVTIIITTHYIEEAHQANFVGIMRRGCLIAEESPKELLRSHQTSSLETVFLKLSVLQNQTQRQLYEEYEKPWKAQVANEIEKLKKGWTLRRGHMRALIWKNCMWFRRNWLAFVTTIILPAMLLSIYCAAIGHNPVNFTVSIVNLEVKYCSEQKLYCDSKQLSCAFLEYLAQKQLLMTFYSNEDDAIESVQKGQSYASITIKSNYSNALRERVYQWKRASLSDIEESTIEVFTDVSNRYMSVYTQTMLYGTLQNFFYAYVESCGINKDTIKIPLTWESLYGWMDTSFTDFITPGALPLTVFTISILLTALAMYKERNEAGLERILVLGINKTELILSHIIVESVLLIPQIILCMVFTFIVFGMTIKGSVLITGILLYLSGFLGICYGMFLSCALKSQIAIATITNGTYIFMVFMCGIVWPIEGMHPLMKPIAAFFPFTKPTETLRNVLHRNWNFFTPEVYIGFLSITSWSLLFLLLSFILIRAQ